MVSGKELSIHAAWPEEPDYPGIQDEGLSSLPEKPALNVDGMAALAPGAAADAGKGPQ